MDIARSAGEPGQPVKIVLQVRARDGHRQDLEEWIRELLRVAARSSALQGSSVLTGGQGEYFVLLRFAGMTELNEWESTREVRGLLRRGETLAVGMEERIARTGLETWFALPGVPSSVGAPPRWKMAVVTWAALLPQIILLRFIVPASWPLLLSVAVSTAIPVAMLTWVLMPWLSRRLRGWLYAPGASRRRTARARSPERWRVIGIFDVSRPALVVILLIAVLSGAAFAQASTEIRWREPGILSTSSA